MDQTPSPSVSVAAGGRLDADLLARAVHLPAGAVEVVESVDSTNAELMRRPAPPSAPAPRVLIAGVQTAGRGRRGRTWHSDPDASLTMSIAVHRRRVVSPPPLSGLSLVLGVALADEFAPQVPGIGLKWPNDLLRDGRKVAGMLIETRQVGDFERIVAGIGVNLRMPAGLAGAIDQPAAGLFDDDARAPGRQEVAQRLVRALLDAAMRFLDEGFADTASRWARFDVLAGRTVVVSELGVARLHGQAAGVDGSGALRVRGPDGVVAVAAGDVSVRLSPPTRAAGESP